MSEIVTGIVTGILTTAILFLLKVLWDKHFKPEFQRVVYRGADLTGSWISEQAKATDGTSEIIIEKPAVLSINQSAHSVKGFLHINTPNKELVIYEVTGEYSDGYLQLLCKSKKRGFNSYGSILLKVVASGQMLHGIMAFRSSTKDEVAQLTLALHYDKNKP
ncbi:hypothetical protein [Pantoea sp. At-9b]|uniref:hypothetical protein n=1 Tax=Pantoea sp. (strain At-9b) TaxID=592316 RepID=UPI0001B3F506|nr:hypothetical protein [Pantoea sp. At-9b]ADU69474.1 conserved hypothetical protein [Pantoea sp. At-9b]